nr:hypothetical protein A8713_032575 [Streptomyces sp. SAT1]
MSTVSVPSGGVMPRPTAVMTPSRTSTPVSGRCEPSRVSTTVARRSGRGAGGLGAVRASVIVRSSALGAEGGVQGGNLAREGRTRRVVPEAAELFDGARGVRGALAEAGAEEFHAVGEQRQDAAAVGEDPPDARPAGEDAAQEQIARGACGVEEELQHGPGAAQGECVGVRR